MPFLLAEQRMGWKLMIFHCARPQKALVGRAQWKIDQFPSLNVEGRGGYFVAARCGLGEIIPLVVLAD